MGSVGLLLSRVLVGVAFVIAGWGKLSDRLSLVLLEDFIKIGVPAVSSIMIPVLGFLPLAEVALGSFLVCGLLSRGHAFAGIGLLGAFIVVLGVSAAKGIPFTACPCFGQGAGPPGYAGTIIRDCVLLILLVPILRFGGGPLSVDGVLKAGAQDGRLSSRAYLAIVCPCALAVISIVLASVTGGGDEPSLVPRISTLAGRILDPDGGPVAECILLDGEGRLLGASDAKGEFKIQPRRTVYRLEVLPPRDRAELREKSLTLPALSSDMEFRSSTNLSILLESRSEDDCGLLRDEVR